MACCLIGTISVFEPMMAYYLLDTWEQTSVIFNKNSNFFIEEIAFENAVCKISAILPWPQCITATS